jgi:hypothetical protein
MNQTKMVSEEKADDPIETQAAQTAAPAEAGVTTERPLSELGEACWSVVSFDKCEAAGLTYPQAEQKMAELLANNVYGLCIITDEAARRVVSS